MTATDGFSRRILFGIGFLLVALVACDTGDVEPDDRATGVTTAPIAGVWVGRIADGEVFAADLTMTVPTARPGQPGGTMKYEYARIECEEDLTYRGRADGAYVFDQVTSTSACSSEFEIRAVLRADGTLKWTPGQSSMTAVLSRRE